MIYFGFGIAPTMFPSTCDISRRPLEIDAVKRLVEAGVTPCLNPSHTASQAGRSVEVLVVLLFWEE